jgi:xanthine permease XanP
MNAPETSNSHILYEVGDKPPHLLSATLGLQTVALILAGITMTPLIALQAVGLVEQAGDWVVFAALVVSGLTTVLQARPIAGFGAGHVLFMGTSGAFLAVSIAALEQGGLPLLGTLVAASALFQFVFARNMALFRRIVTPTVGGTVVTLIAVTIMPIAFTKLSYLPEGHTGDPLAAMWTAGISLVAMLAVTFFSSGKMRLWGPVIGILVGSVVAFGFGLTDFTKIGEAAWVGLPDASWPGMDLSFGPAFWWLLPGFAIVTIIGALETFGDGIAIQDVSQRNPKPTDYKVVQGAVSADGLGNLLSGLMGTLPNTTYSTSISVVDMTGVAARRVGIYGGVILFLLAFCPKLSALLQCVPEPVVGVYITMLLVMLFAHGIRLVIAGGLDFDNGIVFGLSFWLGIGFQGRAIFDAEMSPGVHELLDNGMTAGGITAVLLSWLVSLKAARSYKAKFDLAPNAFREAQEFVDRHARGAGWTGRDRNRLALVVEEAFLLLTERAQGKDARSLTIRMQPRGQTAEVEFISAPFGTNVQTLLDELPSASGQDEDDFALRLLRHMTESVRHEEFHNADFLSLTVRREGRDEMRM